MLAVPLNENVTVTGTPDTLGIDARSVAAPDSVMLLVLALLLYARVLPFRRR